MSKTLQEQLAQYIDSGFPILYLETFEEDKAEALIRNAAGIPNDNSRRREFVEWNIHGLFFPRRKKRDKVGLAEALDRFTNPEGLSSDDAKERYTPSRKLIFIKDADALLEQPEIAARLKNLAAQIWHGRVEDCTIVFVGPMLPVPKTLEQFIAIHHLTPLDEKAIKSVIVNFCKEQNVTVTEENFLRRLVLAFKGLPEFEIKTILALIFAEGKDLSMSDLSVIQEQKRQMVQKSGILEMVNVHETVDDIGGLEHLKDWLRSKAKVLKNIDKAEQFGVDTPKGVLIAGLPGCGKSLTAKAAAALFELPLLRMDMGRLMGKYVGESEANLRRAIFLVEAISPCVLWIDELEKAFAGIGGAGGGGEVTTRLFGAFLTWMQEKESLSFVLATANKIVDLPPELLRKGRFDDIFYVGLPNEDERKKILSIHIKKRRKEDFENINISALVDKTKGYCGADIEGVIKEAVEDTFVKDLPALTTDTILSCIGRTHPLSEIMGDEIKKMSEDYEKRRFQKASR